MTSAEFSEVNEFIRKNTANPDLWWAMAFNTSHIVNALTGDWVDPKFFVPGQVDYEKLRQQKMEQFEKHLDSKVED